jgi:hypothetical protein
MELVNRPRFSLTGLLISVFLCSRRTNFAPSSFINPLVEANIMIAESAKTKDTIHSSVIPTTFLPKTHLNYDFSSLLTSGFPSKFCIHSFLLYRCHMRSPLDLLNVTSLTMLTTRCSGCTTVVVAIAFQTFARFTAVAHVQDLSQNLGIRDRHSTL